MVPSENLKWRNYAGSRVLRGIHMTGKEDLFTPVHKGLRAMIYGLSTRLQTNDFADVAGTRVLAADLENNFATAQSVGCILCALAYHAEGEEGVIFPASAGFAKELVNRLIQEHHEFTRREVEIGRTARHSLELSSPEERIAAGVRINQMANELFAAYITHLNREETELVPLLQANITDAEQGAMRGKIIGMFPPDRLMALLNWMLPAMNVNELSDLLGAVKKGAPPQFMKAVADLGTAKVDSARWNTVRQRVGI